MPTTFATRHLPEAPDTVAPDGSEIRLLPQLEAGSMVHARLRPGACTRAVRHRTVEELWFVLAGTGELWRRSAAAEEVTVLARGTAVSIPLGTAFQFRCTGDEPLEIVIVTMPPWPGADEAVRVVDHWPSGGLD